METSGCIPCVLRQTLKMIETLDLDESIGKVVLRKALNESAAILDSVPVPVITRNIYDFVTSLTGIEDPFENFKRSSTESALRLYPVLSEVVERSGDPFIRALEFSAAGNSIDLATIDESELDDIVEWLSNFDRAVFSIDDTDILREEITRAKTVLFIGDNAGEIVLDRLFIELLKNPEIYFGVRGGAVLNDVTEKDARESGIDLPVKLISSGSRIPGTLLSEVSPEFAEIFHSADVVIAKGQGNFETMDTVDRVVYHLFKVKCDIVANQIGCSTNDFIIWRRDPSNEVKTLNLRR